MGDKELPRVGLLQSPNFLCSYVHLLDSMMVSTLMPRRTKEVEPRYTSADCGQSIKINGCTQMLLFDSEQTLSATVNTVHTT